MQKPQPCKQNWAEMKPTDGGRVCTRCEKTIVDFSNMKWQQIHNFQADRNFEICGFYIQKQILNREKHIPNKSILQFKKIVALIIFVLVGGQIQAQSIQPIKIDMIAIRFMLHSESGIPIQYTDVLLNGYIGYKTDKNGEFVFGIDSNDYEYGLNIDATISDCYKKSAFIKKELLSGKDLILSNNLMSDSLEIRIADFDKLPKIRLWKFKEELSFSELDKLNNNITKNIDSSHNIRNYDATNSDIDDFPRGRTITSYCPTSPGVYQKEEKSLWIRIKNFFKKRNS